MHVGRTFRAANCEATACAAHSDCWNIRSGEVGVDPEVTHTAIAVTEVRSGSATDEVVVRGTEGVNDIGTEQIGTSERKSIIRPVHAVGGGEQVLTEVVTDRLL